ncbi:FecR family protein [uncultured Chitinophaga sp.]|uniref:FecR family protein n=1 Tax=uncultured Chitinophaga sp. TaxID=339340 RepID=UPI0025E10635|nr:FecR family protein [uncultured Chitinophaga sp.]
MQHSAQYYRELMQRYTDGTCTPEEVAELFSYLESDEAARLLVEHNRKVYEQSMANPGKISPEASLRMQERIMQSIQPARKTAFIRRPVFRYAAAAALIMLAATGAYHWIAPGPAQPLTVNTTKPAANDVAPGSDKAVLTLGDGSTVELDSAGNRVIQNGVSQQQGHLKYEGTAQNIAPVFNTLTTPKAGQYQVTLPDGSRVWLNAASSLTFPTAYTGNERSVTLTGEAYFEIAAHTKPFKVKVDGMEVQVLGTRFNVMAYADEKLHATTLLQGAVKVISGTTQNILKPGSQAILDQQNKQVQVQTVDLDKVIAWKTGFFEFDDVALPVIMRQIARWYDVEIEYKGRNHSDGFGGRISRNLPLSDILRLLHVNGVECRIEGRKVIVL